MLFRLLASTSIMHVIQNEWATYNVHAVCWKAWYWRSRCFSTAQTLNLGLLTFWHMHPFLWQLLHHNLHIAKLQNPDLRPLTHVDQEGQQRGCSWSHSPLQAGVCPIFRQRGGGETAVLRRDQVTVRGDEGEEQSAERPTAGGCGYGCGLDNDTADTTKSVEHLKLRCVLQLNGVRHRVTICSCTLRTCANMISTHALQ